MGDEGDAGDLTTDHSGGGNRCPYCGSRIGHTVAVVTKDDVLSREEVEKERTRRAVSQRTLDSHEAQRKEIEELSGELVAATNQGNLKHLRIAELEERVAEVERLKESADVATQSWKFRVGDRDAEVEQLRKQVEGLKAELLDARGERDAYIKSYEDAVILYREGI